MAGVSELTEIEVSPIGIPGKRNIAELQWLECLWNHENMFETWVSRAISVNHSAKTDGIIGIFFDFLYFKGMLCVLIRIASSRRF